MLPKIEADDSICKFDWFHVYDENLENLGIDDLPIHQIRQRRISFRINLM